MNLSVFLKKVSELKEEQYPSVILLHSQQYQPLFISYLRTYLEKQFQLTMQMADTESSFAELQSIAMTSFLGDSHWYWLGNISSYQAYKSSKKELVTFLQQYRGPHRLVLWIPEELVSECKDHNFLVELSEQCDYEQAKQVPFFQDEQKLEMAAYFLHRLYSLRQTYSLDQLAILYEYMQLLGNNVSQFFDEWIEKLIISDLSLFQVSQLFFDKKPKEFFLLWHEIKDSYNEQFWTAYFSDQLYKAYFFCLWKGQVPVDQKQITFGLPFSFTKSSWRLYSLDQLQQAHQAIYRIDLLLKQYPAKQQLEIFLMQWFQ